MTYGKPEVNFTTLAIGIILLFLSISYFMNGENFLSHWINAWGAKGQSTAFIANLMFAWIAISIVFTDSFKYYLSENIFNQAVFVELPRKRLNNYKASLKWGLFAVICFIIINQINTGILAGKPVLFIIALIIFSKLISCINTTIPSKLTGGPQNYQNIIMWKSKDVEKQQALYIREETDWILNTEDIVDLSFKQGYVYEPTALTRELNSQELLKNTSGTVKYNLTLNPIIDNFPEKLSPSKIVQLNTTFYNNNELLPFILKSLKHEIFLFTKLIDDVLKRLDNFQNVSDLKMLEDDPTALQNDLMELSNKRMEVTEKAMACTNLIESSIAQLLGQENMFDVKFNIEDLAQFDEKYNGAKKHYLNRINDMVRIATEEKKKILDLKITILTTRDLDQKRMETAQNIELSSQSFNNKKSSINSGIPKLINAAIIVDQIDVDKIASSISQALVYPNNWEKAASLISKSTSFFKENNIPPITFIEKIREKFEKEKVNRGMDVLKSLVRDTLAELQNHLNEQ